MQHPWKWRMSVTVLKLNDTIKTNLIASTNCPFWTN